MSDNNEQDFAAVLMQHAGGRAHTEATKRFAELVKAVQETGKKGSVTVTLTVSQDKDVKRMFKLDDAVRATIPKESRRSLWFPDDNGTLHRNDPRQESLFEDAPVEKINQEGN